MKRPAYRAAYEAEERKERLQMMLRKWRENAGLTSSQVAERMGVKPPTVSHMEKNVNSASLDTIARYAQACGVTHADIHF